MRAGAVTLPATYTPANEQTWPWRSVVYQNGRAAYLVPGRRPCQPPAAELAKPFHCMPSLDRWAPARCVRAPIRRVQKGLSEVGSILHHEREPIRPSTLVGLA